MIVIRGEMPKGCEVNDENHKMKSCPLKNSCEAYLKRYQVDRDIIDYYPEDCPIVGEIPDTHGDLVELQEVKDMIIEESSSSDKDVRPDQLLGLLKGIPVILEATE